MTRRIVLIIIFLIALGTLAFWFFENRQDNDESGNVALSASVFNEDQGVDGTSVTAEPEETMVYNLTVANISDEVVSGYVVETNIGDLGELADLADASGANYNASTSSLMWTPLDIPAQGSITKQFSVQVKENLPVGSDLTMRLSFGNEVAVNVAEPKVAGNTPELVPSYEAPTTGPSLWFAIVLGVIFTLGVVMYRTAKRMNA